MRRIITFGLLSCAILLIIYGYHFVALTDKHFHLIFCNVGQGDGILIRSSTGRTVIIDGGPHENSLTDCLSRHLPLWQRQIDAVYLTHPDADHLAGLIQVVRTYNVKYFGTSKAPKTTEVYKELMNVLQEKGIPVEWVFRGDKMLVKDGLSITTQWPTKDFINNPSDETNDYSLVQLVKYGNFSALLTGDIPSIYLNSIMPTIDRLDVFKPPHHGSKTGMDEFTLQYVVPSFAVLSFGYHNRYHHPSPEILSLLKNANIPYKDTLKGDIEIVSDGKKWWLKN